MEQLFFQEWPKLTIWYPHNIKHESVNCTFFKFAVRLFFENPERRLCEEDAVPTITFFFELFEAGNLKNAKF